MKRSTSLSAMVAAAALLLAGCGNDAGTATPAPPSADVSASATAAPSSGDVSATDQSGTDQSGTDQSGTDQSGTDTAGTDQSGTDQSGTDTAGTDQSGTDTASTDQSGTDTAGTDQSGTDTAGTDQSSTDKAGTNTAGTDQSGTKESTGQSTDASTGASTGRSTESSDTKPTKTVGGDTVMDAKTTKWFSTFCTGMAPMSSVTSFTPDNSSPAKLKTQIVDLYSKIGTAFTTTSANLKPLPAPTFTGGEEFAATLVDGMATSGKAFVSNAAKVKAADPTNKVAFGKLMGEVAKDMSNATKPLADFFNKVKADPAMVKGLQTIPACKQLQPGN